MQGVELVEQANELLTMVREVERAFAELRQDMDAGFARLEAVNLSFRTEPGALATDCDQVRADFAALRSRVIALHWRGQAND